VTDPQLEDFHDEATWLEWRSRVVPALIETDMVTTAQTRAEFIEGARLLRLDQVRRYDGRVGPTPVQLAIADVLNANRTLNGILEPRRTSKTTSIQAVALGRCALRDDYQVGWTLATTGQKAGERFRKDIVSPIERLYPEKPRPLTINLSKGSEHLRWPNGSHFYVYSPQNEAFRGGAFDLAWVDEGGEADAILSEDLVGSILPTFDTREHGQLVVSGTAAKFRDGNMLWDTITDPTAAVYWHGVPQDIPEEHLTAWEPTEEFPHGRVRELVEQVHPGIGWLTPLEAIERNYRKFTPLRFGLEYLGLFGDIGSTNSLIRPDKWADAGTRDPLPTPPEFFGLAVSAHVHQTSASVAVAWRDARGRAHAGLLRHQGGTTRLGEYLNTKWRDYEMPIAYDPHQSAARVEIERLERARPKPKVIEFNTNDIKTAAALLVDEIHTGNFTHYRQAPLDEAARVSTKRMVGVNGWAFGRMHDEDDPTPLEAVAMALKSYDDLYARPRLSIPSMVLD